MDIETVRAALIWAANEIQRHDVAEPVTDATNLMVNATLHHLTNPGASLRDAVESEYGEKTTYEDVISWIED